MDFRVFSRNISENMHARGVREDTKQALKGNLQADGVQSRRQTLFVRYCLYSVFSPAWTACDFTSSHRYDWRMPPDLLPACRQSTEPDRTAALRNRPALHCRQSGVPSDADRSGVPD